MTVSSTSSPATRTSRSSRRSSRSPSASDVAPRGAVRPAQHGLQPGRQLARRERLRDVVVGADLEAEHAVDLLVARGQHHDREIGAVADLAADVEAVDARQADVEDDDADLVAAELGERVLAGAHPQHAVAVRAEVAANQLADRELVLDDEDEWARRRLETT